MRGSATAAVSRHVRKPHSHWRPSGVPKRRYPKADAEAAVERHNLHHPDELITCYRCRKCKWWHLATVKWEPKSPAEAGLKGRIAGDQTVDSERKRPDVNTFREGDTRFSDGPG